MKSKRHVKEVVMMILKKKIYRILMFFSLVFAIGLIPANYLVAAAGDVKSNNGKDGESSGVRGAISGYNNNKLSWETGTTTSKKNISYKVLAENFSSTVKTKSAKIPKNKHYAYLKINSGGNKCNFHWEPLDQWGDIKVFMNAMGSASDISKALKNPITSSEELKKIASKKRFKFVKGNRSKSNKKYKMWYNSGKKEYAYLMYNELKRDKISCRE